MLLREKYRPRKLSEIIGQPPARHLAKLAANPYPSCWLLEGSGPGKGKTSSAYALAAELGCLDDMSGLHTVIACDLSIATARELFERTLWYRPMQGNGWKVLVIEELESLHPAVCTYLKVALETRLPEKTIVIATSNGAQGLPPALLERFKLLCYSSGSAFAVSALDHLAHVWEAEYGNEPMPVGWQRWGWTGNGPDSRFSLRKALDMLQALAPELAAA